MFTPSAFGGFARSLLEAAFRLVRELGRAPGVSLTARRQRRPWVVLGARRWALAGPRPGRNRRWARSRRLLGPLPAGPGRWAGGIRVDPIARGDRWIHRRDARIRTCRRDWLPASVGRAPECARGQAMGVEPRTSRGNPARSDVGAACRLARGRAAGRVRFG